jgi:hypothetical protein
MTAGRTTDRRPITGPSTSPPSAVRAAGAATEITALVKELQGSAGNRAVARMLASPGGRLLQRRRLPPRAHLERLLFTNTGGVVTDAPGAAAHRAGMERLTGLAEQEMTAAQRAQVTTIAHRGTTAASWAALSDSERDLREADAVTQVRPDLITHDPAHIVTGPRAGTRDAANLASVVAWANRLFARIATGALDAHIAQVFGAANVVAAKTKYANARTRMNELFALVPVQIVTDRSGYNAEAHIGGATTHDRILVETSVFDQPDSRGSVVTLVHEALHAGNADVGDDGGYIYRREEFLTAQEPDKLNNAAHFEVVPRRMLGMGAAGFAYVGETFHPAALPPPIGGGAAPPPPAGAAPLRTPRQEAIHNTSEAFRVGWALADDLHRDVWTRLLQTPGDWNTTDLHAEFGAGAAAHFSDTLPFLSKVLDLTVHQRSASIDPTSADPARQPVTEVDVAISEAVVRKLALGMDAVPATEADAVALETARATPAERAAATSVATETELLIKLVLRAIGPITTTAERDVHVVQTLTADGESEEKVLKARAPAACTF